MKLKEHLLIGKRGFRYLFQLEKSYAVLLVFTSILKAIIPYISIYMSAKIINELLSYRRKDILVIYVGITVGTIFFAMLIKSILEKMKAYRLDMLYKNEQKTFADKIMKMDYEDVEDVKTTYLREQIKIESQTGYNLYYLYTSIGNIMSSTFSIVSSLALSISLFSNSYVSLKLKMLLIFAVLILTIINYFTISKSQKIESRFFNDAVSFNAMGNYLNGHLDDYQSGKEIRIYNMEKTVSKVYQEYINRIDKFVFFSHFKMMILGICSKFWSHLIQFIVYALVIYGALKGGVLIGSMVQYVSCVILLVSGLETLVESIQNMFQNNIYLKTYFSFFDIPSKMESGNYTVEKKDYKIYFDNVSFKYPGTDTYALKDITLEIEQGKKLAIVGENGSGKTTFVKLLCRLYEPTEGKIFLNGVNIRDYDYQEYLSLLGVVFQDYVLFAFSIGQNIAGKIEYDKVRVNKCLHELRLHTLVNKLPNGTDAYLYKDFSDEGVEISGGEAQKLAFARVLYKEAPIIILDEPTAALDPISEYEIYKRINEITKNQTTVYISHRLSSCKFCDRIAVFNNGNIEQIGSHEQLLSDCSGKYYELWNAQAQYYNK